MGKNIGIVLAGGSGKRMENKVKKQYLSLNGKPLLYYALAAFEESSIDEIILVTAKEEQDYCQKEIVDRYQLKKVTKMADSGKERYDSVFSGMKLAKECDIVAVHDGARPFVTVEMIEASIQAAKKYKACAVGVPVKDTIKKVNHRQIVIETPDRSSLWTIQTPQTFQYDVLYQAYEKVFADQVAGITDDAMVVEYAAEIPVHLIQGSYRNIKVTTPEDMEIAEIFEKNQKNVKNRLTTKGK